MTNGANVTLIVATVLAGLTYGTVARAENWQTVGSDKDAFGNDMRVIEIDLDSIRSVNGEIAVREAITSNAGGSVGYNCSEGEIRHGNVDKDVVRMICGKPSSAHPYSAHVPNWQTLHSVRTGKGEIKTLFDLDSVSRINNEVMVTEMISSRSLATVSYDCKGYYKPNGNAWINLDTTDHMPTAPRGFVSLERKAANRVCSPSKQ
jgi:hypothetical protein